MAVKIYNSLGYMSLDVWVLTNIIQLGTQEFCERFLGKENDPCGRQFDQMTQAARSSVANIAEGYSRHQTSRETEMKLLDVSRASLAELLGDYYNFLLQHGLLPWPRESEVAQAVARIPIDRASYESDWMRESAEHVLRQKAKFDRFLKDSSAEVMANALLGLCLRAINMLESYLHRLLAEFREQGGFTENMTAERLAALKEKSMAEAAPKCPKCGAPMVKTMAKKGVNAGKEFWSCTNYRITGCRGAIDIKSLVSTKK